MGGHRRALTGPVCLLTMDDDRRDLAGADATRGGADILGRPDWGRLAPGKRADIAIWDTTGIESAGSWGAAALLLAGPTWVRHLFVEGRQVVQDARITAIDRPRLIERQNALARALTP